MTLKTKYFSVLAYCVLALIHFYANAYGATLPVPSAEYPTIESGIDAAVDGDIVELADGIYTGAGNVNLDFGGKQITVKSKNGPENCIIDCESVEDVVAFYFQNDEDENSRLIGLTIKRCLGYFGSQGGAVLLESSSPEIYGCIFSDNWTGIKIQDSSPIIYKCDFISNHTDGEGGGALWIRGAFSSPKIIECNYTNNSNSPYGVGGAIVVRGSNILIEKCNFFSNGSGGGGAIANSSASATIKDCIFDDNYAALYGGGAIYNTGSTVVIDSCRFLNNNQGAPTRAKAIVNESSSYVTIINSVFSNNCNDEEPHTIFGSDSDISIINCTFANREPNCNMGGVWLYASSDLDIINSIFWDESINFSIEGNSVATIKHSDIRGGESSIYVSYDSTLNYSNNIDANPEFVNQDNNDFHLKSISPCIDAGTNDAPGLPDTDFEGDSRIIDGDSDGIATADMGADEYSVKWGTAYNALFDRSSNQLEIMRIYRDGVLSKTSKGRRLKNMLYRSSQEALDVLIENSDLMTQAKALIATNKDAIADVLNGHEGIINNTDEIVGFLDSYAEKAPPSLKALVKMVKMGMLIKHRNGKLFFGFRLK